jgi:hypothetical protein
LEERTDLVRGEVMKTKFELIIVVDRREIWTVDLGLHGFGSRNLEKPEALCGKVGGHVPVVT